MIAIVEESVDSSRYNTCGNRKSTSYINEYMIFSFNCIRSNGGLNDLVDIVDCKQSLINVLTKEICESYWNNNCIQVFEKNNNTKVLEIILHPDISITKITDDLDIIKRILKRIL